MRLLDAGPNRLIAIIRALSLIPGTGDWLRTIEDMRPVSLSASVFLGNCSKYSRTKNAGRAQRNAKEMPPKSSAQAVDKPKD
jgi:hypothetical protein